jgi:hypothetical protein
MDKEIIELLKEQNKALKEISKVLKAINKITGIEEDDEIKVNNKKLNKWK